MFYCERYDKLKASINNNKNVDILKYFKTMLVEVIDKCSQMLEDMGLFHVNHW
jgi:hypothetical protein